MLAGGGGGGGGGADDDLGPLARTYPGGVAGVLSPPHLLPRPLSSTPLLQHHRGGPTARAEAEGGGGAGEGGEEGEGGVGGDGVAT